MGEGSESAAKKMSRREIRLAKGGAACQSRGVRNATSKILDLPALLSERQRLREAGKTLVMTNGCFDLMHAGHASYLEFARSQGDALLVALNTDDSIRRLKGPTRPVVAQQHRARMMAALECVDYVTFFGEDEPRDLIAQVLPDVLVKAADWAHYVSGRDVVEAHGGRVVLAPMVDGLSTTSIVAKILAANGRI